MKNDMLIKICGITSPETAIACFEAGADMIGLVYYPPSPRHVDETQIVDILHAVEPYRNKEHHVVLVAVDAFPEERVSCFDYVQSYGKIGENIPCRTIPVIMDLEKYEELMSEPDRTAGGSLFALEMSRGILPGGNGASWNWSEARPFCKRFPTLLAGGITPENVVDAIRQTEPYGIDVSSGVESAPGIKDLDKVRRLIDIVREFQFQPQS